jgi:hypothetical protein
VDAERLAMQGISLGAVAGLLAMAAEPRLRAAVAEGAFADLDDMIAYNFQRYSRLPLVPFALLTTALMERWLGGKVATVCPLRAVAAFTRRALFVVEDARDRTNPPDAGRRLYAAAAGPKEYWLIERAGHAGGLWAEPASYPRRVLRFYARHLNGTPASCSAEARS